MKYRYLFAPAFEDTVLGTNDEEVMQGWINDFESEPGVILDAATHQFMDSLKPNEWQEIVLVQAN